MSIYISIFAHLIYLIYKINIHCTAGNKNNLELRKKNMENII